VLNIGEDVELDVRAASSRSCWSGERLYRFSEVAVAISIQEAPVTIGDGERYLPQDSNDVSAEVAEFKTLGSEIKYEPHTGTSDC